MLNRWINRLVRSEERRRQLLRKPKIAWPSLLQTSAYGRLDAISRQSFPERIQLEIELKPTIVSNKEITATVSLDNNTSASTPIYQQLNGDRRRIYGRCASIDLVVKGWHGIDTGTVGIQLLNLNNKILYTKEYFTCATPIVDHQTVINHTAVNALSKCRHIYPYGGYLCADGTDAVIGDALYMMLTPDVANMHINVRSYQDLLNQNINMFDIAPGYALTSIDPNERHKVLPLQSLIAQGEISLELSTKTGEDTWVQSYQSESFVRNDGTYEGVLTFRRNSEPTLRKFS